MPDQKHLMPGDRVPEANFRTRQDDDWLDVSTTDIFAGKTVVVFALPGAFTPTCSSTHLPGYLAMSGQLKAAGSTGALFDGLSSGDAGAIIGRLVSEAS